MLIGGGASQKPPPERSGQLQEELVSANSRYIEEQQLHQQLIIDQQDEQLELVSGSIRVLKHMSGRVGDELDEQSLMLEEFGQEMDHTQSRMDGVLKKMAKVSHMTSETKTDDDGNERETKATNQKAAQKPRCRFPTQTREVKSRLERKLKQSANLTDAADLETRLTTQATGSQTNGPLTEKYFQTNCDKIGLGGKRGEGTDE
ncbi:hypothetical protein KIL84_021085 [Mauremys mutica]|uniref:t-SNARE coiled-coil homology domain-containing protein n=1 Tax=Mauremys mutica TaxID=74926 RepID=A0A9D3XB36_9SAUR|nr:hypothetical protein KIL84_021085 [Mauremys mutica]